MQFNNPSTRDSVCSEIDRICGSSDSTYPLKDKTARVNAGLDRFITLAMNFDKSWSFDDMNQIDLPIGYADIISGRQDTPFPKDALKVKALFVKDKGGIWHELTEETDPKNAFLMPPGNTGVPTKFKIVANSILLDFIPDYNMEGGLQGYFARGVLKFGFSDTTREPGIPSIFHPWLARYASLPFLIEKGKGSKKDVAVEIAGDEDMIETYMASRNQIRIPVMTPMQEDNR